MGVSGCAVFANMAFEITQILETRPTNSILSNGVALKNVYSESEPNVSLKTPCPFSVFDRLFRRKDYGLLCLFGNGVQEASGLPASPRIPRRVCRK